MGDDTACHHVGAITNTRRVVTDGRSGDAKVLQVIKTGDPGAVAADAGVVEDRCGSMKLGRKIGSVNAAMRGVDDNRASGFGPDAGDAVRDYNGSGHRDGPELEGACRRWQRGGLTQHRQLV